MPRKPPPAPGTPVRGSTTGRPIMVLLDILGRRWALRVIWELRESHHTFRALKHAVDDVSSSVLADRIRELRAAGIIHRSDAGYALTDRGRELLAAFEPLERWAGDWPEPMADSRHGAGSGAK